MHTVCIKKLHVQTMNSFVLAIVHKNLFLICTVSCQHQYADSSPLCPNKKKLECERTCLSSLLTSLMNLSLTVVK